MPLKKRARRKGFGGILVRRLPPDPAPLQPSNHASPQGGGTPDRVNTPVSEAVPQASVPAPARADLPILQAYARGSASTAIAIAGNPALRESAIKRTKSLAYAFKTRQGRVAKLALWDRLARQAGLNPELTSADLRWTISGVLREAKFRSACAYVDLAKQRFVESGGTWTDELAFTRQQIRRAVARGVGPPSRAAPFPLHKCENQALGEDPLVPGGPCRPGAVAVIACWWLLREVEVAAASLADVSNPSGSEVRFSLSASKTDPQAKGVFRDLSCVCGACPGAGSMVHPSLCPVCTMRTHVRQIRQRFAGIPDVPLFPTATGKPPTKEAMVHSIAAHASLLKKSVVTRSGAAQWGGHAWRRGGVHWFAAAGVSTVDIQLHARHSSNAILGYLEGANLASLRSMFARAHSPGALLPPARSQVPPTPVAAQPGTPAGAPRYVLGGYGGKVHLVDPQCPWSTVCQWNWQATSSAKSAVNMPSGQKCKRCWPNERLPKRRHSAIQPEAETLFQAPSSPELREPPTVISTSPLTPSPSPSSPPASTQSASTASESPTPEDQRPLSPLLRPLEHNGRRSDPSVPRR